MRTISPPAAKAGMLGISVLEILIAILLTGIISAAVAGNTLGSMQIVKKTQANYAASNLALSKLEQLASTDVRNLDAGDGGTENDLTVPGINFHFTRTTQVVVNADTSRAVTVTVTCNSSKVPTTVVYTTTFSIWG